MSEFTTAEFIPGYTERRIVRFLVDPADLIKALGDNADHYARHQGGKGAVMPYPMLDRNPLVASLGFLPEGGAWPSDAKMIGSRVNHLGLIEILVEHPDFPPIAIGALPWQERITFE